MTLSPLDTALQHLSDTLLFYSCLWSGLTLCMGTLVVSMAVREWMGRKRPPRQSKDSQL